MSGYWFMVRYLLKDVECAGRTVSGCGAGEGALEAGLTDDFPPAPSLASVHVETPEQLWEIK